MNSRANEVTEVNLYVRACHIRHVISIIPGGISYFQTNKNAKLAGRSQ